MDIKFSIETGSEEQKLSIDDVKWVYAIRTILPIKIDKTGDPILDLCTHHAIDYEILGDRP